MPSTVSQSLTSMLGVAIRIAQRMGIHRESALAKCSPVEAEMRRRLWWSLALFDSRICQISGSETVTLESTWDCQIPLNVNDSDLRPEMKVSPTTMHGKCSEALFVVVRAELGEFFRRTEFHLVYTSAALEPNAKHCQVGEEENEAEELKKLEEKIETLYLQHCDQENPIHYMTIWATRAHLAKYRLLEHHSRHSSTSSVARAEAQRDTATTYALRMLECDTKVMASPLTTGFIWMHHWYFPFPAYMQIVQDLRRRPTSRFCDRAWEVMSDNYEAWLGGQFHDESPFYRIFAKIVLQAWDACEAAHAPELSKGSLAHAPRIVLSIRDAIARKAQDAPETDTAPSDISMGMDFGDFAMPSPMFFTDSSLPVATGMTTGYAAVAPAMQPSISAHAMWEAQVSQYWNVVGRQPGWQGW